MTYYSDNTRPSTYAARGALIRLWPDGSRLGYCPICGNRFRVHRGNALGRTNELRGMLGRHIRSEHPEVDSPAED